MTDLYEYEKNLEKPREREEEAESCPLGQPDEYEPGGYEFHQKLILIRRKPL